jgi:hypothetical protein
MRTCCSILGICENISEKPCNAFWRFCVYSCGPVVTAVPLDYADSRLSARINVPDRNDIDRDLIVGLSSNP